MLWVYCAAGVLLLIAGWSVVVARAGSPAARIHLDVSLPSTTPTDASICLAGNFQGWSPNATPLIRDSATHAHGTINAPADTALEFKFTRGTWATTEKALDCSELPNRTAVATPELTITVTVENWADNCVLNYDARAQKVRLESAALGLTKQFYVYTPPGYAASPTRRYPVLYLFRGYESEWINKHQDGTRQGRNVIDVYEELLAAGRVGPMLLVFPGLSSDDNSVPGLAINMRSATLTRAPGIGTGRFEDYFLGELIPYVDAHYRTVASKAGRGLDGFSLGGFTSVKIAAQHPEKFTTVGAFDGTHFYANSDDTRIDAARDAVTFANPMFDPVFGRPRDLAFAARNNGPSLVAQSTPAAMQSLCWFIQFGPRAAEPDDSNYLRGEYLLEKLRAKGVTNEIASVLPGGHNWKTADEHMRQTLPLHWSVLNPEARLAAPESAPAATAPQGVP